MLRGRGIADRVAPSLPAIIGSVHATFIRGPQLSALHAGAEQRRDGAGWLRPTVVDALPTSASQTTIHPPVRTASYVRGVRVTPNPANVMGFRSWRKRPVGRSDRVHRRFALLSGVASAERPHRLAE